MTDQAEMQCSCSTGNHAMRFEIGKIGSYKICQNMIPYKHHHDWSDDSDFMCQDCLDNCRDDK